MTARCGQKINTRVGTCPGVSSARRDRALQLRWRWDSSCPGGTSQEAAEGLDRVAMPGTGIRRLPSSEPRFG